MKAELSMDEIVNLCKTRGFVFAGSEIYGGLANAWDYGPLGVELKNNIKKNGLTPQKNKVARHIKTYSDYGVPSNSIINELCGQKYQNEFEEQHEHRQRRLCS